jgi:Zn-dependent protease with chaperone function
MGDVLGLWVIPAVLALVPAAARLHRGRIMARHANDPALAERLVRGRTLLTFIFAFALALEIVLWGRHVWWSIPLLCLTFLSAGLPLRRALFNDTWSLAEYLWFYVRLFVGIYGFWILLMVAPWVWRGRPEWSTAAALGVGLMAWNAQWGRALRFIMRAQPITTPTLLERFARVDRQAAIPTPRTEIVDMCGGVLVNALALPDTVRPGVLFTSSLIDRLEEREVAAIYAHEVAHLEHFNRDYLIKLRWVGWALIAGAVLVGPLAAQYLPRRMGWVPVTWPMIVIIYNSVLMTARQKHETECDLRAVALSGDAEAVISGLSKAYALGRLPRRLDPNAEVTASHPSLARRIQAIRAAGALPPIALAEPVVIADGVNSVTLHADRLIWNESTLSSHTIAYDALDELRLDADGYGAMRLTASDPHGRRWTIPIAGADLARAQAALDVVDTRLRPTPAGHGVWRTIGMLVTLLGMVAAAGTGQLAALIVAALALASFERPLVSAAAVAGVISGVIAIRDGGSPEFAAILILAASLLLFVAYRDRRAMFSKLSRTLAYSLGALALLTFLPVAVAVGKLLTLHQAARDWPAPGVFALGFAGAAACFPGRWRAAAVIAGIAGVASVTVGSTRVLDALLHDPFAVEAPPPVAFALPDTAAVEFDIGVYPSELRLSPDGRAVAVIESHEDDDHRTTIHIGRPGARLTPSSGDDLLFVDNDRALMTRWSDGSTLLRLINVDDPAVPLWEMKLDLGGARMAFDRATNTWQVLGYGSSRAFVRVIGPLEGGPLVTREWPFRRDRQSLESHHPLWADESRILIATKTYRNPTNLRWLGSWAYWLNRFGSDTRFSVIDDSGVTELFHSPLEIDCQSAAEIGSDAICSATDGSRAWLARVNQQGKVIRLGQFRNYVSFDVTPEWVTGWSRSPFAIDLRTGKTLRVRNRRNGSLTPTITGAGENVVAVAWAAPSEEAEVSLKVRLYQRSAMR